MQTLAKIRLRKPTRVFPFLASDIQLKRNDSCIVRSDRGLEFGTCVVPPEPCPPDVESRYNMSVVRKANHQDESTFHQLQLEEKKARNLCTSKINDRHLPMKLVDVEYTFDKHKVIFYFTAADRVDFRELVRDLAHELKTRIELRHIQVRDEAKLVGGLGVCGRELCCSTWLREFMPISMKMAKRQNLSLNPSKISGQCGRLLCCLSYENDMYKHAKKVRATEDAGAPPIHDEGDLDETVAPAEGEYPWQVQPPAEGVSAVTDEHIHGPSPRILDEERHASSVVDINAEEEDEEVIDVPDEGVDVTIVDLPHGSPGAPQDATSGNGHDGPRKRKRRRRRRPSGSEGGPATEGGGPAAEN